MKQHNQKVSENGALLLDLAKVLGIAVLVVLGTFSPVFSAAAFGIAAMQIIFGEEEFSWMMLIFLYTFANIFKLSAESTSLFTFLNLLFVAILFWKRRTLPGLWVFLAIYMIAIPVLTMQISNFNILRWTKLLCSLLLLYYFFDPQAEHKADNLMIAFITGNIASSLTRYLDSDVFRISKYVIMENFVESNDTNRFSGLYSDPNYYSINIIIALCLVVILFHRRRISIPVFAPMSVILISFAILTYSKSAMLMLMLPLTLFLYSNRKTDRQFLQIVTVVLMVVALVCVFWQGDEGILGVILNRFSSADGDINKLTTGRFNIWKYNMEFFISHPGKLFWGQGINAALLKGRGHHNVYLEMLYHLGVVGSCLLYGVLHQITAQIPHGSQRNYLNYSVLICTLVMYFFLSELFYFDPPFHLMMAFYVLNLDVEKEAK